MSSLSPLSISSLLPLPLPSHSSSSPFSSPSSPSSSSSSSPSPSLPQLAAFSLKRPISSSSLPQNSKRANSQDPLPSTPILSPSSFSPMSTPPPPNIQRDHYLIARQTRLILANTWFLIHRNWFQAWAIACSIPPESSPFQSFDDHQLKNQESNSHHAPLAVSNLPSIDNSELIDPITGQLKLGLSIGLDCEIVPETFWNLLVEWYGLRDGHTLARKVIAPNGPGSESLELHPPVFQFYLLLPDSSEPSLSGLPQSPPHQRLSIGITLGALKSLIQTTLFPGLLVRPIRLWLLLHPPPNPSCPTLAISDLPSLHAELVAPPSGDAADLNEALLTSPLNHIAVEHQTPALIWPANPAPPYLPPAFGGQQWLDQMEQINQANLSDPKFPSVIVNGLSEGSEKTKNNGILSQIRKVTTGRFVGGKPVGIVNKPLRVRGLVGLTNLGNTCFMNSALQCLSNCPELKRYFLSRVYINELNRVNPLGMGGKVAETFGQLVERLWMTQTSEESSTSSIAPREFKAIVGRFNSLFLGYGQQDSQELLTFLLDALHEDLNRVLEKPFDAIPDFEDEAGDEGLVELSEKCWELYRRRNDSVIVDLFQGQYKSTLVCPDCQKVAIKFDEIMYLTLQLPIPPKKLKSSIYFIPMSLSKPRIKVCFEVNKDLSIRGLKVLIGNILSADPNKMAVIEDWSGKPWKIWHDTDTLENLQERDVLNVFETPFEYASLRSGVHYGSDSESDELLVPVVSCRGVERGTGTRAHAAFGVFFVVRLGKAERGTYEGVYGALVREYGRYTKNAGDLYEGTEDEPMDGRPGAQPVPNLFRIVVPQNPGPAAFPVSNAMSGPTVDLEARIAREVGQPACQEDDTSKAVFEPDEPEDLYESDGIGKSSPGPAGLRGIREGDYIECHWTPAAMAHFFGLDKTLPESRNWVDPPVVEDPEMVAARTSSGSSKKERGVLTIEECFKDFSKPERLGEDDKWYCPRCKEHVRALKRMQIWKVPDILVVHFKRFSNASGRGGLGGSGSGYGRPSKVDEFVDFPIEGLDLKDEVEGVRVKREIKKKKKKMMMNKKRDGQSRTCGSSGSVVGEAMEIENRDEECNMDGVVVCEEEKSGGLEKELEEEDDDESLVYDLFAVDNHFGGLGGGHYTAMAKNEEDGKWHNYDDSHVSEIKSVDQVKSSAAYLLFYKRRTCKSFLGSKTDEILKKSTMGFTMNSSSLSKTSKSSSSSSKLSKSLSKKSSSSSLVLEEQEEEVAGEGEGRRKGGLGKEELIGDVGSVGIVGGVGGVGFIVMEEETESEGSEEQERGSSGRCVSPGSLGGESVGSFGSGSETHEISSLSKREVDEDYDGMEKQVQAPEVVEELLGSSGDGGHLLVSQSDIGLDSQIGNGNGNGNGDGDGDGNEGGIKIGNGNGIGLENKKGEDDDAVGIHIEE